MPAASARGPQQPPQAAAPGVPTAVRPDAWVHAPAGNWRLHAREALALQPRRRSVLRVAAGGLWVTVTPHNRRRPVGLAADIFLRTGDSLVVEAGARAVLEPWPADGVGAAFAWDLSPLPPLAPVPHAAPAPRADRRHAGGAAPWAEWAGRFRAASGHAVAAGTAARRLWAGLRRWAAGRRRNRHPLPAACDATH